MPTIILFTILILLLITAITTVYGAISFAPWLPCRTSDLKRIFKVADLKDGEIFCDLGCGDGKTVIYAGKNFNVKAIGIELSLPLFIVCKIRQCFNANKKIQFKWKNFFKEDISNADVIYIFGVPKTIKNKLKEKIKKEAKPGARVVSYVFKIEGWEPEIINKPSERDLAIYLYKNF